MRRRCWPSGSSGLGGLTMSEDGGWTRLRYSSAPGELLLETSDGTLERLQPRLLGVQLRLLGIQLRLERRQFGQDFRLGS